MVDAVIKGEDSVTRNLFVALHSMQTVSTTKNGTTTRMSTNRSTMTKVHTTISQKEQRWFANLAGQQKTSKTSKTRLSRTLCALLSAQDKTSLNSKSPKSVQIACTTRFSLTTAVRRQGQLRLKPVSAKERTKR